MLPLDFFQQIPILVATQIHTPLQAGPKRAKILLEQIFKNVRGSGKARAVTVISEKWDFRDATKNCDHMYLSWEPKNTLSLIL